MLAKPVGLAVLVLFCWIQFVRCTELFLFWCQYPAIWPLGLQTESRRRRWRSILVNVQEDGQTIRRTQSKKNLLKITFIYCCNHKWCRKFFLAIRLFTSRPLGVFFVHVQFVIFVCLFQCSQLLEQCLTLGHLNKVIYLFIYFFVFLFNYLFI